MEKLVLLDSNSLLNRAYYAINQGLTDNSGNPTNAIFGFMKMFTKIIETLSATHLVAVFDVKAPTFRKKIYEEYKATRKPMNEDLAVQIPRLKELLRAMNICIVELAGYEADDLIGTISKKCKVETIIVTGDRDSYQLIDDTTKVLFTSKGVSETQEVTESNILEIYGCRADQVIDLKALQGDASDNIPGVGGVGSKTALELLREYETLDNVYANIDKIKGAKQERLIKDKEKAYLSQTLARIKTDCPIEVDLAQYRLNRVFSDKVRQLLAELAFKSMLSNFKFEEVATRQVLPNNGQNDLDGKKADDKNFLGDQSISNARSEESFKPSGNALLEVDEIAPFETDEAEIDENSKGDAVENLEAKAFLMHEISFCEIKTSTQLDDLIEKIKEKSELAIFIEKDIYVAYNNKVDIKIVIKQSLIDEGLDYDFAIEKLKEVLANEKIMKICFDYKMFKRDMFNYGVEVLGFGDDVMLLSYVFDILRTYKRVKDLLDDFNFGEGFGAAKLIQLRDYFRNELARQGMITVYEEIEKPLAEVLLRMEMAGFKIDTLAVSVVKKSFRERILLLAAQIEAEAGESFNINSSKQLGKILFEKLGLAKGKKTKTAYSTDADVLISLQGEHSIVSLILEYREISKLLSTYIEGMEKFLSSDGRIHTIFKQALTATGRLSSIEPNLQNIPIRKKEGRELRKIFIAGDGCKLVCADYSQIELRLLAHFSKDKILFEAYKNGDDIHSITASKVYGVALEDVTPQMRSSAKAVNFGIIYGISDYGLSRDLGIPVIKAREFIEKYFESYPEVSKYMALNVDFAKKNGYVSTLSGRKRRVPELSVANYSIRKFGERVAMNTPLQGSASDVMKVAMIRVDKALVEGGFKAKMIMQVHDELIIDTPIEEVSRVKALLKREMEEAYKLDIPMTAEVGEGDNWLQAK